MAKAFLVKTTRSSADGDTREDALQDGPAVGQPSAAPQKGGPTADLDLVAVVRRGLRFSEFEKIVSRGGLGHEEAARALGIAPRTLARRKVEKKLDSATTERVVRLARVVARASDVLGDEAAMRSWIRAPNASLGGQTPLSLLDTDVGTAAVLTVLGRLEHGVFS